MAFFEVEFPRNIGYKRLGSPAGFSTSVNEGFGGDEQRNRNWANSRGKWTIDLETPPPSQLSGSRQSYIDALVAFFSVVGGRADAFRLKDHLDYQASTQTIGVGNGSKTVFQLTKTYTIGGRSYIRTVTKPITSSITDYQGNSLANTVRTYLNAVNQASGWSVDQTTGIVTFVSAPGNGVVVTSDFQFHYPVRFDTDDLPFQVEESNVAGGQPIVSLHGVQLLEVRPPNY